MKTNPSPATSADSPPSRQKAVRIIDIAKHVGVSPRSISKVLFPNSRNSAGVSEKTAKKIREAANQLGYLPNLTAKQLAGESPRMIGALVAPFAAEIAYKVLALLEQHAAKHDYRLLVAQVHDDIETFRRFVLDFAGRRLDGVICFVHENFALEGPFKEICALIPNMIFVGPPEVKWGDWLSADLAEGVRMIVNHLYTNGRRRIALFQPCSDMAPFEERILGFTSSLETLKLSPEQCPIWRYLPREITPRTLFEENLDQLLAEHPKLDAIVTANDVSAMYVMQYLHHLGIAVPKQIAVTGFDNSIVAAAAIPPITSLNQCTEDIASQVIETVLARISAPTRPRQSLLITPKLCVRESSVCPTPSLRKKRGS